MDLDALTASPVGQLVPIRGNDALRGEYAYFAFLPEPLPNSVALEPTTWASLMEASAALGRLDQACRLLPDPKLLIRPALWREAVDTSALEGTYATLPDVLEAQVTPASQFVSPEVREIRAYERMALAAFELIAERPITMSLLSDLQAILAKECREPSLDHGRVRLHQVMIGPKGCAIEDARYIPPPPDDRLTSGLDAWVRWVEGANELPPLLATAMAHYQFEALHPFGDGNGRIGRLVIVLQLLRYGVIGHPAITVSPWFLKRREEYQAQLLRLSYSGDWNPWVQFFCRAVCDQCQSLINAAGRLLDWLENTRRKLHERRWTGTIHLLVGDLIEWPVVTVAFAADRYRVSTMTATRMVDHLVEIGVLSELTGRNYRRIFGAEQVMATVEAI